MSVGETPPNAPPPATPPATPPAQPATPPPPPVDPEVGFQKTLAKMGGDIGKLAQRLYRDSFKDRETIRGLTAKIPPEGALVLHGDELKAFETLKALGKKPEEIRAILDEHAELKSAEAKRATDAHHQELADLCGFNAKVLGDRLAASNIEIEVQEPPGKDGNPQKGRDGKPIRVAMVKTEDPSDKRKSKFVPLVDWAAQNWPEYLPALKGSTGPPARPNGTPPDRTNPPPPKPPVPGAPAGLYAKKNPF